MELVVACTLPGLTSVFVDVEPACLLGFPVVALGLRAKGKDQVRVSAPGAERGIMLFLQVIGLIDCLREIVPQALFSGTGVFHS